MFVQHFLSMKTPFLFSAFLAILFLSSCDRSQITSTQTLTASETTLSEMVQASHDLIDKILESAPEFRNYRALQNAYSDLARTNPKFALEDVENRSNLDHKSRNAIVAIICSEWALKDRVAVIAYLEALIPEERKTNTWHATLYYLSKNHLEQLMTYLSEVPAGSLRDGAASLIVRNIATHNPEQASKWANEQLEEPLRSKLIAEIFFEVLEDDPKESIVYFDSLKEPEYRLEAVEHLAVVLRDIDVKEGFKWFQTLQNPAEKNLAYPLLIGGLFAEDPNRAVSEILKLEEGNLKNELIEIFIPSFAGHLPDDGLDWVKSLTRDTPSNSLAIRKFLGAFSLYQPEAVLNYAVQVAGADLDFYQKILLELADHSPMLIVELVDEFQGSLFYDQLLSKLTASLAGEGTVPMRNWVKSFDDEQVQFTVIGQAWPLIIKADPYLAVYMIEQMPNGPNRKIITEEVAQELLELKAQSEFVKMFFNDDPQMPEDLVKALDYYRPESNQYLIPEFK